MAVRNADQMLKQSTSTGDPSAGSNSNNYSSLSDDNNNNSSNRNNSGSSGKKKYIPVEYVESVVEVDTDNKLPEYEAQALTDPLVQQYANKR